MRDMLFQTGSDHFVTAGFDRHHGAGLRLAHQARRYGVAPNVARFDLKDLAAHPEFWSAHKALMNDVPSGHFIWKPFVISRALQQAREGDVVLYCDAGCEFNPQGSALWEKWLELAARHDVVLFSTGIDWRPYCKAKTIAHFADQEIVRDLRFGVAGGAILLRNSQRVRQIIARWYELCVWSDYCLSDDNSYDYTEAKDFVAHRHDQSILHQLVMRSSLDITVLDETLWRSDWRAAKELPILALRNRFEASVLHQALSHNAARLSLTKRALSALSTFAKDMLR